MDPSRFYGTSKHVLKGEIPYALKAFIAVGIVAARRVQPPEIMSPISQDLISTVLKLPLHKIYVKPYKAQICWLLFFSGM